ncbi:hypothetical protein K2Y11_12815 [bacterium]|nr:hypothetical protein [bacterium]
MARSFRTLQSIRLEPDGSEFVLVLTATLGTEITVERIPLGEIDQEELITALESALADLRSQKTVPSAA